MSRDEHNIYLSHFACFNCRKTFKKNLYDYIENRNNRNIKCPQCGEKMKNMGKDFESPPKKKVKEWKYMELLFKCGITFHSYSSGPGFIPRNYEELLRVLIQRRETYMEELKAWIKFGNSKNASYYIPIGILHKENTEQNAKKYLTDKIAEINKNIEMVKSLST